MTKMTKQGKPFRKGLEGNTASHAAVSPSLHSVCPFRTSVMSSRLLAHRTVLNAARVHRMVAIRSMSTQGQYQEMDSASSSSAMKAISALISAAAVATVSHAKGV